MLVMSEQDTQTGSRVFIVDDNPANTMMLQQVVETESFSSISVFHDPEQALMEFYQQKPDLILLDLVMPKLSGIEFMQNIEPQIRNAEVSVVVLTASHNEKMRIEALSLGALDYIEKPFNIIETLQRIRNIDKQQQRKNSLVKLSASLDETLKKTREDLSDVLLTLNAVFEHSTDYVLVSDIQGNLVDCNIAAQKCFSIRADEGVNLFALLLIDDVTELGGSKEIRFVNAQGRQIFLETSFSQVEVKGNIHYIFIFKDITCRKEDEATVRFLTETHYLTHLPNRHQLKKIVQSKMAVMEAKQRLSFIFLAFFDNAKEAELHGHEKMESLLFNIALTLVDLSSEFGSGVIHWGDNDFLMVEDDACAQSLVSLIQQRFEQPVSICNNHDLVVYSKPTIGLYESECIEQLKPEHFDGLVHNALLATYDGARAERRLTVFDAQLHDKIKYQARIEKELIKAIDERSFRVAYQPKVDLNTGVIIGVEALVRWQHQELGMIRPDVFIPIAEGAGLINEIGEMVLRMVVADLDRLTLAYPNLRHVAVNVAAPQLDNHFVELLEELASSNPRICEKLELEITETSFLDDFERVNPILRQIKDKGFRLAIDDFGTGYSSLSYLHELPIDTLKIDRSFIIPILQSEKSLLMVKSIISMSHSLGLEIVAEGIEDDKTGLLLRDLGVQTGQGYHYYKPAFLM